MCGFVDWGFLSGVWTDHTTAINSTGEPVLFTVFCTSLVPIRWHTICNLDSSHLHRLWSLFVSVLLSLERLDVAISWLGVRGCGEESGGNGGGTVIEDRRRILGWTISALGDDHSLEKLIEAVPGFVNSKLVKDIQKHLPWNLSTRFYYAFRGFLGLTLSSNSVIDKVKLHRLDISLTAINSIHVFDVGAILEIILTEHWDQVPKTVEIWHTLAPWCTSNHQHAQAMVAKVLWTVRERDDHWFGLAARVYDLPERDLRDILTHDDDSVSLSILIQLTRRSFRSNLPWNVLEALPK